MATVSQYPTPDQGGPVINNQLEVPVDYEVTRYEYEDGGVDVNVQPCGVRRWELTYQGLTDAEAALLDAHYNLAKGKVDDFSFLDRSTGLLYTGCNYERYEIGKSPRSWLLARRVTLRAFV